MPSLLLLKKCWTYPTNKLTNFNFASDNKLSLYAALSDGKLLSVNGISGEKRWEAELGGEILSAPLVTSEDVFIAVRYINDRVKGNFSVSSSFAISSINKATGVTQWKVEHTNEFLSDQYNSIVKAYLFNFSGYLILALDNAVIYSIDRTNGRIIWKKSFNTKFSSEPFMKADRLILGTKDNKIIILSASDGRLIEILDLSISLTTIVQGTDAGNLILGDAKGLLVSFNKRSKTQNWRFRYGGEISDVRFTREGILVSSLDNYIYMVSETNGKLLWKKRFSGRVLDEPQVYDNYVIIAVDDDSFAAIIRLDDGKLVNRIILESDNTFTGDSIQIGNYVVYATLKGMSSFMAGGKDCLS